MSGETLEIVSIQRKRVRSNHHHHLDDEFLSTKEVGSNCGWVEELMSEKMRTLPPRSNQFQKPAQATGPKSFRRNVQVLKQGEIEQGGFE